MNSQVPSLYDSSSPLSDQLDAAFDRAKTEATNLRKADFGAPESTIEDLRRKSEVTTLTIHVDQAKTTTSLVEVIHLSAGRSRPSDEEDLREAGLMVVVRVPYTGNRMLLQYLATGHQNLDVSARLLENEIEFSETFTMPTTAETIREWRGNVLARLTANADLANAQVHDHNEKVAAMLPRVLNKRQADEKALRKIAEELDS